MFTVKVDPGTIAWAQSLCSQKNFGMRNRNNGSRDEQEVGVIGQQLVMDMMSMGMMTAHEGFDGGVDFTYNDIRTDVKTVGRTVDVRPDYNAAIFHDQFNYDCDAYIFCSFNKNSSELTICGWVPKDEFVDNSQFKRKGEKDGCVFREDCHIMKISQLRQVSSADDLIEQFINHSVW